MRICYIASSQIPSRTANSVHVMKMCQAYADLGADVTLIVPRWRQGLEGDVADVWEFYGVGRSFEIRQVVRLGSSPEAFLHSVLLPLAALWPRPDLVHTRSLLTAWSLTRVLRLPTVLEAHVPLTGTSNQRRLLRSVVRSSHLRTLVLITNALWQRFRPDLPQGIEPLIAPDGVDERWLSSTIGRNEARRRIGLEGEGRAVAMYTGHLYPGRGVDLIVDIAAQCTEYLFLVLGGESPQIEDYRRRVDNRDNVRFLGFHPPAEIPIYLKAADVLLMPYADQVRTTGGSNTAGYASPMKLFEYLAAGRPILASTLPVLQEVLEDRNNALLLPFDQPQAWVAALKELRRDPSLGERLALRGSRDALLYTWQARARSIIERATHGEVPTEIHAR